MSFGVDDERFEGYYEEGDNDPRKYEGAPVSLQLVGRRYKEEEILGMVEKVLEDLTKGRSDRGVDGRGWL
jgi:hypothetical protein